MTVYADCISCHGTGTFIGGDEYQPCPRCALRTRSEQRSAQHRGATTLTALPLCSQDGCRCGTFHPRDRSCPDCAGTGYGPGSSDALAPCQTCSATFRAQFTATAAQWARDGAWAADRAREGEREYARQAAQDAAEAAEREEGVYGYIDPSGDHIGDWVGSE